jgi:hypothetical protein
VNRRSLGGAAALLSVAATAVASVHFVGRRWGATRTEVGEGLPGDALVPAPKYEATYDWLENLAGLGIHSADRDIEEYQDVQVGDLVRLAPQAAMVVAILEPERALVIRSPAVGARYFDWSWAFVLKPLGGTTTRLIVRVRADYQPSVAIGVMGTLLFGPLDFLMSRKMLLGIKSRAEGDCPVSPARARR